MSTVGAIKMHLNPETFNPDVIMASGQVFRMFKQDDLYYVYSADKALTFRPIDDDYYNWEFYSTPQDWARYWGFYFDLISDYNEYNKKIKRSKDEFLLKALEHSKGMRILRQDLWETLVTFIISQQNNIPKITKTVQILCDKFGTVDKHEIAMTGEFVEFHKFPTIEQICVLSVEELSDGTMLGYRAEYILKLAQDIQKRKFGLKKLSTLPYEEAIEKLQTVRGIGLKVSNCVALYGLHLMESYPIDTWMNKIIKEDYPQHPSTAEYLKYINSKFKGFQGYVQQIQFYYKRSLKNS